MLEMRRQAERMRTIIKDLLELSKLESGEHTQEEHPVDMGGMLALIRKEVMTLDQHPRNVRLQLDSDALLKGVESELHSAVAHGNAVAGRIEHQAFGLDELLAAAIGGATHDGIDASQQLAR